MSGFGSRRSSIFSMTTPSVRTRHVSGLALNWHDAPAMLLLRMSSSLTALSITFLDVSSTIKHFH